VGSIKENQLRMELQSEFVQDLNHVAHRLEQVVKAFKAEEERTYEQAYQSFMNSKK